MNSNKVAHPFDRAPNGAAKSKAREFEVGLAKKSSPPIGDGDPADTRADDRDYSSQSGQEFRLHSGSGPRKNLNPIRTFLGTRNFLMETPYYGNPYKS